MILQISLIQAASSQSTNEDIPPRRGSVCVFLFPGTLILMVFSPAFDGAYFSEREKEALWTGLHRSATTSVEQYNIVKRA